MSKIIRKTARARLLTARNQTAAFARAAVIRCANCGQIEVELPAPTTHQQHRSKAG